MKPHLLQIGEFPAFAQAMIESEYSCHTWADVERTPELRERIKGIITRSNYEVPDAWVESLPNLGIIATCGVGYDRIPLTLAYERNVKVANTPDVLNSAVAELAVGLILALLRQLPGADRHVRTGSWAEQAYPLGESMAGKHVGIVGLGRIGKEIARRLTSFDVVMAYYGRTDQHLDLRFEPSLTTLADDSDILIIAAPGGTDTTNLIDRNVLQALGPEGRLVNISRGSLVNEDDLYDALASGAIAGAALDVYKTEPQVNSRFAELDNVLLTPHIGSATHQTRKAMTELTLANLQSFFRDGSVLTPVVI